MTPEKIKEIERQAALKALNEARKLMPKKGDLCLDYTAEGVEKSTRAVIAFLMGRLEKGNDIWKQ